ncbi:MAG: YciI family protein [Thiobacillus sp.]|nr:YciI family protein [Thiobacillus sp.]
MRFMIIVKATDESEAETSPAPDEALLVEMADYHERLAKAGVLLDGSGLTPSSQGWRIRYNGEQRTVIDGPFAETKELIAGYTLIQVKSREEAMEWARRFPNPAGAGKPAEIEVRPLYELEDFGPSEAVERFRDLGMGGEPAR